MKRLHAIAAAVLVFGLTLVGRRLASKITGSAPPPDTGWITLFDGSSLVDWEQAGNANWTLANGMVQADSGSGYLVSRNSYVNYELRGEFWVQHDTNSGILVRAVDPQNISQNSAYEVNIHDDRPDHAYGTGAIVGFAKVSPPLKVGGQWNTFVIHAKGSHLIVRINGRETVNINDNKYDLGRIALQHTAGTVKFRKVEIKPV